MDRQRHEAKTTPGGGDTVIGVVHSVLKISRSAYSFPAFDIVRLSQICRIAYHRILSRFNKSLFDDLIVLEKYTELRVDTIMLACST